MTRRTRRLLLAALPVAVLAAGLVAWLLWPPPSAITRENAEKIRAGMTLAEVEALLGGPARNESGLPDHYIDVTRRSEDKCWASERLIVVVVLDDAGRVIQHSEFPMRGGGGLATLRRWLGL
jgi:hypothetical protein